MTKQEAINTLISFAVCCDPELHCDTDCPFYKTNENEDNIGECKPEFEINIKKAIEVLKKDIN